jgi:SAM-dependent methyltransferase
MGYSARILADVLGFDLGPRIIDVGSQEVHIQSAEDLATLNAAISNRGGEGLAVPLPASLEAVEVFKCAGFDYWRCDVDGRPNTVSIDISTMAFPHELKGNFDYVGNAGTTEHLANPTAGFALIHYLCKPGGIMFHDVPVAGFDNHGLNNPTLRFWHHMIWMNGYSVVDFQVVPVELANPRDAVDRSWTYMRGTETLRGRSAMARVALRKVEDHAFLPPLDVPLRVPGKAIQKLLLESLRPFVAAGTYTEAQAHDAVTHAVPRFWKNLATKAARRILS